MTNLRTGKNLTALTLLTVALCSPAFSQEGTGIRGTLSFSQGIEVDDGEFATRTGLGFGIRSETRVETFDLNLGTELLGDFANDADKEFSFVNQNASVGYTRAGSNSRLSFSLNYTEVELDDEVITGVGGGSIITSGSAETKSANLGLEFGVEGPLGVSLDLERREVDYIDTLDPDLNDFERTSADVLANFRIRPSLTIRALAGIERTDEDDLTSTETEDTYVGIGAQATTAGGLSVTGDILYDRTETTVAGPTTTTEDGIGIDITVAQTRPDGLIELALSSRVDDAGRRTSAEVRRDFDLRNGALALSLGVVDQEDDDQLRLIGGIAVDRDTKRGTLAASLVQDASTSDGDPTINTVFDVNLTQEINNVSSWSAGLGFVSTDTTGGTYDSRSTATFSYSRDLTEDWELNTGVEYSKDRGEDSTNTVFLNIRRDFTFGF